MGTERPFAGVSNVTAFGARGPDAALAGMDLVVQGRSGLMVTGGRVKDGLPTAGESPIADYMAAALLAFGVASALYRRERTGRGGRVDTSLLLAALALQTTLMVRVETLDGPRHAAFREWLAKARRGGVPFAEQVERMPRNRVVASQAIYIRTYATKDGALAVACGSPSLRRKFIAAIGHEDPALKAAVSDVDGHYAALRATVEATLASRTTQEWKAVLDADAGMSRAPGLVAASLLASCAMTQMTPAVRADLAPTGTLRAGINYGNFILAQKDEAGGESRGVAIDLTRELAQRLGVPVELIAYTSVAAMVDAAKTGAWDIAFLGIDPAREGEIGFTAAYLEIEATYLVPAGSPLSAVADVDREGVRVAAPARANYELFLSRSLTRAQLVRAPNADAAFDLLVTGKADALAGLRQALIGLVDKLPGSRMLDGQFMRVPQAVGVPRGRDAGLAYLRGFVEDAKASGLVARAIEKTGAPGVSVAPEAPTPSWR